MSRIDKIINFLLLLAILAIIIGLSIPLINIIIGKINI